MFGLTCKNKQGIKGSLFLQLMVSLVVMIVFREGYGTIPALVYVPYGLEAVLLLLWRNPYQNPVS